MVYFWDTIFDQNILFDNKNFCSSTKFLSWTFSILRPFCRFGFIIGRNTVLINQNRSKYRKGGTDAYPGNIVAVFWHKVVTRVSISDDPISVADFNLFDEKINNHYFSGLQNKYNFAENLPYLSRKGRNMWPFSL